MRVLHVIEPASFGGAEAVVKALSREAVREGVACSVAAISQSDVSVAFAEDLRDSGVEVDQIRCGRRRYLAEARALSDVIRRTHADIVHTHVYHADLVGYRAARAAGVPVVSTVHGFTEGSPKNRFYQWIDLRALRRFDGVMCVSESVRHRVLDAGTDPRRVHLVPNGYAGVDALPRADARAAFGLEDGIRAVGWVGRLSVEKGADLMIASAEHVPRDVAVVLVGDGPERAALEQAASANRQIRFAGMRPDAGRLLRAFDAVAISSRTEGLPIVLLEAMAAGVPVVSFAVGGIPDVVGPESAWLVKPGDVAALGEALGEALEHPDEARRRADVARAILDQKFGAEQWLDRVQRVYREVLRGSETSR